MAKKKIQNRSVQQTKEGADQIEIRTFGRFTVLKNGLPVHFSRNPSKVILAFLVDHRGQTVTKQIIASEVFNEDRYDDRVKNRMHTYLVRLKKDLELEGLGHILYVRNNDYGVITGNFYCDCYDLLEGNKEGVKDNPSNYMEDYEWADARRAFIEYKYYGRHE